MYELALVISIIASFYAGFRYRDLKTSVSKLTATVKEKIDKPKIEETKSNLIDPYDFQHRAEEEHELLMKRLNNQ